MLNIESFLMAHEPMIRLGFFVGMLGLMALWEAYAPRRRLSVPRLMRWFSNVGLLALGTLAVRSLFPFAVIGVAAIAEEQRRGLFYAISLVHWQAAALSIICLDLTVYLHHVLFHALPTLWRIHRVHHADLDFDVTTGLRFHPLELLLSLGLKIVVVLLLGAPVVAVLIFEVLLNATSMFTHGNVRLPSPLDHLLRLFVVTPDMHRIHHSSIPEETNSNFGFNLPWWDYIFGTYRKHPSFGHKEMTIGLADFQKDLRVAQLHWMLVLPFLNKLGHSSINQRKIQP